MSRGLPEQRALAVLGTLSGLLYLTAAVPLVSVRGGALAVYLTVFPLLFGIYLAAVWVVRRQPRPAKPVAGSRWSTSLATILGFGLLFRVLLLPTPVYLSSDPYRYFWDGRVQLAGINPYRYPPAAPELTALRDGDVHPNINRPGSRTIYPPGAQWIFVFAAAAGVRTVLTWRILVLVAEAVTVTVLLGLLRRLRLPETAVLVYVWSPLVVFEGVQGGHLDLLMVPLVLLALWWRREGAAARAGFALGLAVLVKLYPAVLALAWSGKRASVPSGLESHGAGEALRPARSTASAAAEQRDEDQPGRGPWIVTWWRSRDWRFVAAVGATVALGYAPYVWATGAGALGFLPEYFGSAEDHNIGLRALLTWGIGWTSDLARTTMIAILFVVLLGALLWIGRAGAAVERTGAAAIGAYLALVPTAMHPWYVVWIVPFLCLVPSRAWLYFTGAVSLSYVAYLTSPAPLPAWAWLAQYGPLFGLLAVAAWRSRAGRPATVVVAGAT